MANLQGTPLERQQNKVSKKGTQLYTAVTPAGTAMEGGSPDQAKMSGTPAQTENVQKEQVEQATSTPDTQPSGSIAESTPYGKVSKLKNVLSLVGQAEKKATDLIQQQQVVASINWNEQYLDGLVTNPTDKQELKNILSSPIITDEMSKRYTTITQGKGVPIDVALQEARIQQASTANILPQINIQPITMGQLGLSGTDIDVTKELLGKDVDVANLTIDQFQQLVQQKQQEVFTQTEATKAQIAALPPGSAMRRQLEQTLTDLAGSGVSVAERELKQEVNKLEKADKVTIEGKDYDVNDLLKNDELNDRISRYMNGDLTALPEGNPIFAKLKGHVDKYKQQYADLLKVDISTSIKSAADLAKVDPGAGFREQQEQLKTPSQRLQDTNKDLFSKLSQLNISDLDGFIGKISNKLDDVNKLSTDQLKFVIDNNLLNNPLFEFDMVPAMQAGLIDINSLDDRQNFREIQDLKDNELVTLIRESGDTSVYKKGGLVDQLRQSGALSNTKLAKEFLKEIKAGVDWKPSDYKLWDSINNVASNETKDALSKLSRDKQRELFYNKGINLGALDRIQINHLHTWANPEYINNINAKVEDERAKKIQEIKDDYARQISRAEYMSAGNQFYRGPSVAGLKNGMWVTIWQANQNFDRKKVPEYVKNLADDMVGDADFFNYIAHQAMAGMIDWRTLANSPPTSWNKMLEAEFKDRGSTANVLKFYDAKKAEDNKWKTATSDKIFDLVFEKDPDLKTFVKDLDGDNKVDSKDLSKAEQSLQYQWRAGELSEDKYNKYAQLIYDIQNKPDKSFMKDNPQLLDTLKEVFTKEPSRELKEAINIGKVPEYTSDVPISVGNKAFELYASSDMKDAYGNFSNFVTYNKDRDKVYKDTLEERNVVADTWREKKDAYEKASVDYINARDAFRAKARGIQGMPGVSMPKNEIESLQNKYNLVENLRKEVQDLDSKTYSLNQELDKGPEHILGNIKEYLKSKGLL